MRRGLGQHPDVPAVLGNLCACGDLQSHKKPNCLVVSRLRVREQHLPSCAKSSKSKGNLYWKEIWVKVDTGKKYLFEH